MRWIPFKRMPEPQGINPTEIILWVGRITFEAVSTSVDRFRSSISARVCRRHLHSAKTNSFSLRRMKESKPEVQFLPEALSLLPLPVSQPWRQFQDCRQRTWEFFSNSFR